MNKLSDSFKRDIILTITINYLVFFAKDFNRLNNEY